MAGDTQDPPSTAAQKQQQRPEQDQEDVEMEQAPAVAAAAAAETRQQKQQQQQQQPGPPSTTTRSSETTRPPAAKPQSSEPPTAADTDTEESPPEPAAAQQPQPPPPPPPPAPGPRAARLQALFASTVKHTLDKISRDNFASCFPTVAARAPGTLEFVQRQMVERLGGLWQKEFETILQNRSVVARLNELEALVADAARRREESADGSPPVAPHTLPPQTVLAAHLHPHLAAQRSQLNARLQNTQAANARLWAEVAAQRAEAEALLAAAERAVADMDGASDLLAEVAEELAAETRAAEAQVRSVRAGRGGAGGGGGTG